MYSITNYAQMLADPGRRNGFVAAMRQGIKPGDVVLDLGAGFGALALLACKLGAARVYAVDPNPVIHAMSRLAADNGIEADRIRIYCQDSRKIDLPEQVDVIIADLRSFTPLFQGTYDIVGDACRRFLKPGGKVIPYRDTLHVVPLAQEAAHADYRLFWDEHDLGLDFGHARELAMCAPQRARFDAEHMLAAPAAWGVVEYGEQCWIDTRPELAFSIERDGLFDGIGLWFDMDLTPSVRLSNDPRQGKLIYGTGFFAVPNPVKVERGDTVVLEMAVRNMPDREYWTWGGRVLSAAGEERMRFKTSNLPLARLQFADGRPPEP